MHPGDHINHPNEGNRPSFVAIFDQSLMILETRGNQPEIYRSVLWAIKLREFLYLLGDKSDE